MKKSDMIQAQIAAKNQTEKNRLSNKRKDPDYLEKEKERRKQLYQKRKNDPNDSFIDDKDKRYKKWYDNLSEEEKEGLLKKKRKSAEKYRAKKKSQKAAENLVNEVLAKTRKKSKKRKGGGGFDLLKDSIL